MNVHAFRFFSILTISFLCFMRTVVCAEALDGYWWSTATKEQKTVALQSFFISYRDGYEEGNEAARISITKTISEKAPSDDIRNFTIDVANVFAPEIPPPTLSKPLDFYRLAIDAYFRKYRRARNQSFLVPLLACLADAPQKSCDRVSRD